jgi:lysine-specific demethylase/histidyl-hydroxylase NO66
MYITLSLLVVFLGIARAIIEDGKVVLYHCMDNARYFHFYLKIRVPILISIMCREMFGTPISPLEFDLDDGPAIEALLNAYPNSIIVQDLPHNSEELEEKISIAQSLFKEGILLLIDENESESAKMSDDDLPF